jgi:endonuclease/exonuclease/phosphatase family metal-dependent hydrolase
MRGYNLPRTLEAASILLFFLQALRVLFSVLFGIIYDQIFDGPLTYWLFTSLLLVVAAFLAPWLTPRSPGRSWLVTFSILASLGRIALSINDPGYRFWGSLVVLAAGGIYLASLIALARPQVLPSLITALVLDQLFRVAGDTYDLSLREDWFWIQVFWSALLVIVAVWLAYKTILPRQSFGPTGIWWGLALGSFFFLQTSLLSLPNAVARWSGASYPQIAVSLLAITSLPLSATIRRGIFSKLCRPRLARGFLGLVLVAGLLVGYFNTGILPVTLLLLSQAVMMVGIACLLGGSPSRLHRPGPTVAVGMLFFLLLNFLNAFTFTYPYVIPALRGLGWAVYLLAALVFGFHFAFQGLASQFPEQRVIRPAWLALAGFLSLAIALFAVRPLPTLPPQDPGDRRIATYNIHYGYDSAWRYTLSQTADTIRREKVDLAVLQEVDTGRLTSYGVDNAYFLARRLGMHVIYLPTVEHLTGIALLSRDAPLLSNTRLLTSLQEQTGVIHAYFEPDGQPLHAYATWLGLSDEDTMTQVREALDFIGSQNPAVFGGDFNAEPDSPEVAAILQAGFFDPFESLGLTHPPTSPSITPQKSIDFVWLRLVNPVRAWVPESLASDHRMVVVQVKIGP